MPRNWAIAGQPRSSEDAFGGLVALLRLIFTLLLRKKTALRLTDLNRCRTFWVIVGRSIDPRADREATRLPSVEWLQEFRDHSRIRCARIEPSIVAMRIENHRHSVMDRSGKCVCCRRQNRTRFQSFQGEVWKGMLE